MEKDKKNGNNGNGAFTVFATSNRGMIQHIIEEFYRRNRNMDKEDITQETNLAILEALCKKKIAHHGLIGTKDTTFIFNHIKWRLAKLYENDHDIIIKFPDDSSPSKVVTLTEFMKMKNTLPTGTEYETRSRFVSYTEENKSNDRRAE
jgi:hypothetical protein